MVSKDKNIVNFDDSRKKRAAEQKQRRKSDERKEKEALAEANRVKFGRTGAQKRLDKKRQADAALKHKHHRLAPSSSDTKQTHTRAPPSGKILPTRERPPPKVVPFAPSKAAFRKDDDK